MASGVNVQSVDKAFRKTIEFERMAHVGRAAFTERLTGGFDRLIKSQPAYWQKLKPSTIAWKLKRGMPPAPWIVTGETLRQLSSGALTKMGVNNGSVVFKISRRGVASITPRRMAKSVARKKGGRTNLWGLNSYGLAFRPIDWVAGDPERIRPYVEKAIAEAFRMEGIDATKR